MCPGESEWLAWVGGATPPAEVRAHLDVCPECRAVYERLAATWNLLGAWEVQALDRDLSADVVRLARRRSVYRRTGAMAASVLLTASLGVVAALITGPTPRTAAAAPLDDREVAGLVGLDALGGEHLGLLVLLTPQEPLP
jgi:predicted anti-sigma-YlaC factor YlaD